MADQQPSQSAVSMFERSSDAARKAMALANQEAQRFNHEYIGTEHVLLGIVMLCINTNDNASDVRITTDILKHFELTQRNVRIEVDRLVKPGPKIIGTGKLPQTPRTKKLIEYAIEEARQYGHSSIDLTHLMLGLIRITDGVAAQVMQNVSKNLDAIRLAFLQRLGVKLSVAEAKTLRANLDAEIAAMEQRHHEEIDAMFVKCHELWNRCPHPLDLRVTMTIDEYGRSEKKCSLCGSPLKE